MQKTFKEGTHNAGVEMIDWGAESRNYKDFDKLHPVKVFVLFEQPNTTSL